MQIGIDIRLIGKKQTGSESVFFNLVKNLAEIDSQNKYRLFTDIADEKILKEIKGNLEISDKNNFEIISLKTRNKFTWNFWTLPRYLRQNPLDIYLTQYITPFFVPKSIKIFTIIHDISFNFYPQLIKFADLFFLKILIPMSLKRADKIIAVSEFTKNEIERYYKIAPEKIAIAYNAVGDNFANSDLSPEKLEAVRQKYRLPEKFILYLGTMQPRKNLPVLIEAFAKICSHLTPSPSPYQGEVDRKNRSEGEIKLVLAGGKGHNYDQRINEMIKKNSLENEVVFPGFIDEEDKPALYKLAEIFCFPSLYEGFGIPILEAMTSGTPTITSAISPHKEIAANAALFFDPKNPNDLAEKLNTLLENENIQENLKREGPIQAQKFSWQKTAQKMLDIFKNTSIDK